MGRLMSQLPKIKPSGKLPPPNMKIANLAPKPTNNEAFFTVLQLDEAVTIPTPNGDVTTNLYSVATNSNAKVFPTRNGMGVELPNVVTWPVTYRDGRYFPVDVLKSQTQVGVGNTRALTRQFYGRLRDQGFDEVWFTEIQRVNGGPGVALGPRSEYRVILNK